MDLLSILLVALGLSADCFAVALSGSISMPSVSLRQVFRTAFSFGFFQFGMAAVGWLAGGPVVQFVADFDHWVAFAVLALVGGRMIWEAFRSRDGAGNADMSKGLTLVSLSVATSIDAFAVGLSLAFFEQDVLGISLLIGLVAFAVTALGFAVGRRVGALLGSPARVLGGLILIGIGVRTLITHTF
ncbi:MAG: manganese efflux pump [Chloroflexi bacterium]|nr:manganese efflux pump [Chloroflexota bacterium]